MNIHEYRRDLIASHPHVGLADDKKREEVRCSCGWAFRHPRYNERRGAILEHLANPAEQ